MYQLESFFRNTAEARDFYKKLHDSSKPIIIFSGSGANGKTALLQQIKSVTPKDWYFIIQDEENLFDLIPTIKSSKKTIYVTNHFQSGKIPAGLDYDVVEFPKTFSFVTFSTFQKCD